MRREGVKTMRVQTGRIRIIKLTGWLAVTCAAVFAVAAVPAAGRTVTVKRCGYVGSGSYKWGIYPVDGHVSCKQAKALMWRAQTKPGIPTGSYSDERYPDGWLCGGQMGYYFCGWPYSKARHPFTRLINAQACHLLHVGCPARIHVTG
jgi:hypothetical protein